MSREQRSELYVALSEFWREQLDRMRLELPQLAAGSDVEALHRFRVALRRTRSLLKLFRTLLPEGEWDLELLEEELAWLSGATSAVRDLDVLLIEVESREVAALRPVVEQLERQRRAARQALRDVLTSHRLQTLLLQWQLLLDALPLCKAPPPEARVKLGRLFPVQLLQLAHWLLKHGSRVGAGTPASELHRLRIRAKRLRYLIEAFPDLLPERRGKELRRSLVALQDLLGSHQDAVATAERLTALRGQLAAPAVAALDEWLRELAENQRRARLELPQRLLHFGRHCDAL